MLVAHHPARHPFVDAIAGATRVAEPSVWDVDGLRAAGVDVVHIHFGFEHLDPAGLADWVRALAEVDIALVHTVHDLDNPHLVDQAAFHRNVDALVAGAGAVATLTAAAANVLEHRYGVTAAVVPHPRVVPVADVARWRRRRPARHGIYVHAATGRPNLCLDTLDRLVAASDRPPVTVHVRPTAPAVVRGHLDRLAARGRIHVDVRARLTDAELWARLAGAQLLVLPYRWGTHSGLLEAAHDLGTPVLAPAFGGYGDQGATTFDGDPAPIIAPATARRPAVTAADRRRQARRATARYAECYRLACARVAA